MTEELKPVHCGCGGKAVAIGDADNNIYFVKCDKCWISTDLFHSKDEAIRAWNRAIGRNTEEKLKAFWDGMSAEMKAESAELKRTAKVVRVDKKNFKCLNCGQNFHAYMWAHPTNYCSFCGAKLDWSGNEDNK